MDEEERKLNIPGIGPEELYKQDERRREWDDEAQRVGKGLERLRQHSPPPNHEHN